MRTPIQSLSGGAELPAVNVLAATAPDLGDVAYVKLPNVLAAFPVSPSTWYALIRHGVAPEPVKLGSGSFWRTSEVRAFLARDPAEISEALRAVRNARKAGQRGATA
ncbi:MAG: hypothetical protein V4650_11415 [Pseudomonadota bacterium]